MPAIARDRLIVLATLVAIAGLAWAYLFSLSQAMPGMDDMPGMAMSAAPAAYLPTAAMWSMMMIGMMLPTAAPMILLFSTVQRRQGRSPVIVTGIFAAGYVLIWGGFALAAAVLQSTLGAFALLSPSLTLLSIKLAGLTFLVAAAYEMSPLKSRCLKQCSPIGFIMSHWRPGLAGAFRMGLLHGVFCVGCCWVLMLLLFAVGVMNLFWVAALAVLVLVQKLLPYGRAVTAATAGVMAAIGTVLLVHGGW